MSVGKNLAFLIVALVLMSPVAAWSQTFTAPFNTSYSFVDLGSAPGVPTNYGGLVFKSGDPSKLLLGGAANAPNAVIDAVTVTRGLNGHVNGFSGTATQVSTAPAHTSGGIDGGLIYAPNGALLYTGYADNSIGEIKPGSSAPDKFVDLTPLGVASSVGWLGLVPAGFAGTGHLKILSYNTGNWYDASLVPDGSGTYNVTGVGAPISLGSGPEGAIYIKAGNPQFASDSVLICNYQQGVIDAYTIDANGDPIVASKRNFISGLTGAEGATIDPVTGDFLFATFGGGNHVIEVNGFLAPEPGTPGLLGMGVVALLRRRGLRN